MKINTSNKTDNKLLNRVEAKIEIDHSGEATPSRESLKPVLATKLGAKPELIIIRSIRSTFGSGKSTCSVHIYKKEADLKLHEPKHLLKRDIKEKKAPVDKPAEAPKEEAPAEAPEEPKEEKSAEEPAPVEEVSKEEPQPENEAPAEAKVKPEEEKKE